MVQKREQDWDGIQRQSCQEVKPEEKSDSGHLVGSMRHKGEIYSVCSSQEVNAAVARMTIRQKGFPQCDFRAVGACHMKKGCG